MPPHSPAHTEFFGSFDQGQLNTLRSMLSGIPEARQYLLDGTQEGLGKGMQAWLNTPGGGGHHLTVDGDVGPATTGVLRANWGGHTSAEIAQNLMRQIALANPKLIMATPAAALPASVPPGNGRGAPYKSALSPPGESLAREIPRGAAVNQGNGRLYSSHQTLDQRITAEIEQFHFKIGEIGKSSAYGFRAGGHNYELARDAADNYWLIQDGKRSDPSAFLGGQAHMQAAVDRINRNGLQDFLQEIATSNGHTNLNAQARSIQMATQRSKGPQASV